MNEIRAIQVQVAELITRERWAEAERHLALAFAIDPDNDRNHILAATIAVETRSFDDAERHLTRVFARDPESRDGLFLQYSVQRENGRLPEAELSIRSLLRLYPEQAAFYVHYAELMLSTLHVREARVLLREAKRLSPDMATAEIIELLADVVEGKRGDARDRIAELIRKNPENQDIALALALVLQGEHRYREAREVLRSILRATPDDAQMIDPFLDIAVKAHWSAVPLLPVSRYGFGGLIAVLLVVVSGEIFADIFAPAMSDSFLVIFFIYLAYTFLQPRLLKRWFGIRGVV